MRTYDFDETIYNGDSTRDFYFYCLKKYPRILLELPRQFGHFLLFATGIERKTVFKSHFYRFFRHIPDMDKAVADFWETHFCNIKEWYLSDVRPDDVIISASPAFLLEIPCRRLGLTPPIASLVDKKTGAYTGENCYGEEKPPRFRALYPDAAVEEFYSDSLSDMPMALLAKERFIVRGDNIMPWESYVPSRASRAKKLFLSPAFLRFLLVGGASTILTAILGRLYLAALSMPVLSFALGYITTLILAFFLHAGFTFRAKPSLGRFWKFVISYIPNFLVQTLSVWLLCHLLSLPEMLAYILAAIIGIPVTFLLMKLFAFQK